MSDGLITDEIVEKAREAYRVKVFLHPDESRYFYYTHDMRAALEAVVGDIIENFAAGGGAKS